MVLRRWLSGDEVTQLRAEVESRMRAGHGAAYDERPWMSGMAGHYIPMLDPSAPLSCALVEDDRFHAAARSLLDGEWPSVRAAFEAWLDEANFDAGGRQRRSLAELRSG